MAEAAARAHGLRAWLEHGSVREDDLATSRLRLDASALGAVVSGDTNLTRRLVDEGEIARGAQTSIRRVFDLRLRRHVAMKVLDPRLATGPRDVARFEEEARITGWLDHPHIPPVHELDADEDGTRYFLMKLVEARPLGEALAAPEFDPCDEKSLEPVLQAFVRACDAVAFAHAKGVVHCDLRPANLWTGAFGQVYVMDFGSARFVGEAHPGGVDVAARALEPAWAEIPQDPELIPETSGYIAPEQAKGDLAAIGPRTDVFCLGAVLYRILTRQPPWTATEVPKLLKQASDGRVEPPWMIERRRTFPRRLGEIAMKALASDPAQRYERVELLRNEVDSWLRGDRGGELRTYPPGATLVREGDVGEEAFVIRRGRARAFKTLADGRHVLREMGPGDVFGEAAIFASGLRSASVEAIEELEVSVVQKAFLDTEMARTRWLGDLVRALAKRFTAIDDQATKLGHQAAELGLASEILTAMLRAGATRELRWSPLRVQLCRRHRRSGPETDAIVQRLPMFHVDVANDQILFVEELTPRS